LWDVNSQTCKKKWKGPGTRINLSRHLRLWKPISKTKDKKMVALTGGKKVQRAGKLGGGGG